MGSNEETSSHSPPPLPEMIVRTLRHEVGDLLQSVYSAVAILQERLPREPMLERTILTDLRSRAESCKHELDAAHDLICPLALNLDWVDLGEVSGNLATSFSTRYPKLGIVCEVPRPLLVWGDTQRLVQVGTLLMLSFCPTARSKVSIGAFTGGENVEWRFAHDGPAANDDQLSWLAAPFSTTRHARFGLALSFARRVTELHGGSVRAGTNAEGGFQMGLVLPSAPSGKDGGPAGAGSW